MNFLAEVRTEPILDAGHLRREQGTGVDAAGKDKRDREHLAAEFLESETLAVLIRQRELGCRPDL